MQNTQDIYGYDYKVVAESRYSSLRKNQAQALNKVLHHLFKKEPKSLVDCTAHIGSDTLNFASLWPKCKITSIEVAKDAFEALEENVEKYGNKNITVVHANILDWLKKPKFATIYYFDPPWNFGGGQEYLKNESMYLYIDKIRIGKIIKKVIHEYSDGVLLKVPKNFDFDMLNQDISNDYDVYDINTKYKLAYKLVYIY